MKFSNIALITAATLSLVGAFTAPALAIDGRAAVNLCIDRGPACKWEVHAGGIDIFVDGHYIECPPPGHGDCAVVFKTTGKPPKMVKADVVKVLSTSK